ncbi:MAG: HlyC/CorC family transporter [Pyrinomonadaceae bacterium]|nr:HlyC/CorC family transporter [Pyrinomonadaceae bacterium]
MGIEIIIATVLLILLTLLASVDMAFSQLSDVSLRRLFTEVSGNRKKGTLEFLREVSENRPRFRFTLSSAIQILLIVFSVIVVLVVYRFTDSPRQMLFYSLGIGLALSVVFRQVLPRLITWSNPEGRLLLMLPLVRPIYVVLPFLADPLEPSFRGRATQNGDTSFVPDSDEDKTDDDDSDDIQALIEVGEAEGIIEEEEREMIEKMIEFTDTEVDEIMTPRTEICGIEIDATVTEVRDLMIGEKYSRLPVYRENIDNIEGVIYVRDILNAWAEGKEDEPIKPLLRTAYFVPETKAVSELLESMQKSHVQISIVIDEYGGVAGLVTVEDILEEIVGEIEDEDQEELVVEIAEDSEGYWKTLGSTEIGKIERHFNFEIEDDDFTTIAGLVTSEAGYVPKKGEKLSIRGLEVEVIRADAKKIHMLRIKPEHVEPADQS